MNRERGSTHKTDGHHEYFRQFRRIGPNKNMNELTASEYGLMGGALADDGAALAAKGINDIRSAKLWEGAWFVGTLELYVGAGMFYGGWLSETIAR